MGTDRHGGRQRRGRHAPIHAAATPGRRGPKLPRSVFVRLHPWSFSSARVRLGPRSDGPAGPHPQPGRGRISRSASHSVRSLLGLFALALVGTFFAGAARAQTPVSPNRVTFYTEPNFRGDALAVEAGASVPDLGRMQRPGGQPWLHAISSIQVDGDARATVYASPNRQGDRLEVSRSIADLYGETRGQRGTWDRAIASLVVDGTRTAPPPAVETRPAAPPTTVIVVPAPPPPPPGRPVRPVDLREIDAAIHRAFREVLNRPADPEGLHTYRRRLLQEGWNERQIVTQLQRSDEARAIDATAAITRLYREELGREPDPQGLAHYRAKWREGWTQGRIRDDLRRSRESRQGHIHSAITRAYRDLLGREPDPAGYANFERLMRDKRWSERDVRASIMASDEYRDRQPPKKR